MPPKINILGSTPTGAQLISFGNSQVPLLEALTLAAKHYAHAPHDPNTLETLFTARRQIAAKILAATPAQLPELVSTLLTPAYNLFCTTTFICTPLPPQDTEFLRTLTFALQRGDPHAILAASLFTHAHLLPLPITLGYIPDELLDFTLRFLLSGPPLFQEIGEADHFTQHLTHWTAYLHQQILANPQVPRWEIARDIYSCSANFVPAYMASHNVRDLFSMRGDILEFTLRHANFPIDQTFPPRSAGKKIRLGILAHNYLPSPETFAALPLYEHLPDDFETTLYALHTSKHPLQEYCASRAKTLKPLPTGYLNQVNALRADDLDLLFIATNPSAVINDICILSLHRLARKQIVSVSSVVTTGLRNIDHYLSSKTSDPSPNAQSHYRESLLQLEGSAHCFSYGTEKEADPHIPTRESLNIRPDHFVFAAGANMQKILPELQLTWTKILAAVPNSVLLLYPFSPTWSPTYPRFHFYHHFTQLLRAHNLVPARLILLDPRPIPTRDGIREYLKLADLYLDSFPFTGSTSLIEPLEVGLPIITRTGPFLRNAMAAALLQELNLPELITQSEQQYIALAINLATNAPLRQSITQKIHTAMTKNPAFLNPQAYAKKLTPLLHSLITPPHILNHLTT